MAQPPRPTHSRGGEKSQLGFPAGSAGKESACNVGDLGSIPGLGRSPGQGIDSRIHGLPWWLRQLRICLQCKRPGFNSWVGKIPQRKDWLPTPVFLGFPSGSDSKESACTVEDLCSIPG